MIFHKTFIYGDYWQQHYPWAHEYARCIKEGRLPYWVPGMAGGFPLVAEGQVGAYYPFHLLLYATLPFSFVYTFLILAHVLIGGIGFYCYAKKIGLSAEAASLCAVLYSFSSAYGGCFSNTASLRVLAWLPWALLAVEWYVGSADRKNFLWVSLLGVIFAMMWTAGSGQAALYAVAYLSFFWLARSRCKAILDIAMANGLGLLLSLPQWVATLELVPVSVRAGESASFALWGSVFPPALISLIYPNWGIFLGLSFYIGAASIFLVLACFSSKMGYTEKIHASLLVVFVALALGKYNPVYSFLVHQFSFTALRNPSKFIFFSTVSLVVLAGFGFDRLKQAGTAAFSARLKKYIQVICLFVVLAPLAAQAVSIGAKSALLDFAHQSAAKAFADKKDPAQSLIAYHEKAEQLYGRMKTLLAFNDPWNLTAIIFFLLAAFVLLNILKKDSPAYWRRVVLPAVLLADLFVFGSFLGTGFVGNARALPIKPPLSLVETIHQRQSRDGSSFVEWAEDHADEILSPNANLLYSLNHAGGYSPLLIKNYYELVKTLGIADSSLGRQPCLEETWKTQRGVLEALGVSQILSPTKLGLPGVNLEDVNREIYFAQGKRRERTRYLYGLPRVLPRVYTVSRWKVISDEGERLAYLKSSKFSPFEEVIVDRAPFNFKPSPQPLLSSAEILSSTDTLMEANIDISSNSVLVYRNTLYPGWKAELDGKIEPLIPANHLFSGVFVGKGRHHVRFFFDNKLQKASEAASFLCWMSLLAGNFLLGRKKR